MNDKVLVIGGCRSGKSRHALDLAESYAEIDRVFIATCIAGDDEEMKDRVRRHQAERGNTWTTVETPVKLASAIRKESRSAGVILADCLTLWMSNLLMESMDTEIAVNELVDSVKSAQCPVILVSNEVGTGIVPENPLARHYRDAVGFANQKMAAAVDKVIWMTAGIPVGIKGG